MGEDAMVVSRIISKNTAKKPAASVVMAAAPPSHQLPKHHPHAQISVGKVAATVQMACQLAFVRIPFLEAAMVRMHHIMQNIARKCATSVEANLKKIYEPGLIFI